MNKLNRSTFFAEIKKVLFPDKFEGAKGALQIKGLDIIITEWEARPTVGIDTFAYILATTYYETAFTMQPVKEYGSDAYLKAKDYWPWIGRGYVQLTWEKNYRLASKALGVDLIANPDLALDPKIAVRILFDGMINGWFSGKSLSNFIDGVDEGDVEDAKEYDNARKVVNGVDKKKEITSYALEFRRALKAAQQTNTQPIQNDTKTTAGTATVATGGLIVLIQPLNDFIKAIQDNHNYFTPGNLLQIGLGVGIIGAAATILYARWDAAGRPVPWRK